MIHGIADTCRLIAASPEQLQAWGRFAEERSIVTHKQGTFLISACAILLVSALISYWLTKRRQNEFWQDSPTRLFHDLCRGHQLELATRRLLKKLALARGLESAAELFIEPNYFNPAGLPPAFEPSAHELQRFRRTLFG